MQDEDILIENAGFEPFEFQLANGNNVKIFFAQFWEAYSDSDRAGLTKPQKYFAIKVYSNEDRLVNRMAINYVFRANHEFGLMTVPKIWTWLEELIEQRGHIQYDSMEEFVGDFADQIALLADIEEDAVEHIEHLPEITDPEAFDKVDDSVFNDQNDSENVRGDKNA